MIKQTCENSKSASKIISKLDTKIKNNVLSRIIYYLKKDKKIILEQNKKDLLNSKMSGRDEAFLQRLAVNEKIIRDMIAGIEIIIKLDDPVKKIIESKILSNGLKLEKISVPLGVVLVIYESRPNVTIDVASICIKSGNAVILKGGSDALNTNIALYNCIKKAFNDTKLDSNIVQFVSTKNYDDVTSLLSMDKYIDVVIPRGGKKLIESIVANSRIPVIKQFEGVCTIYVDKDADFKKAISIIINAKIQKPSACNSVENVIVHDAIKNEFLPLLEKALNKESVEIRGCNKTKKILAKIKLASVEDYKTEYLAKILSIKIVNDLDESIKFIETYSSGHSEAIITENVKTANKFLEIIDSAAVYHNASTRFTDGGCFDMGCEIGISTQKIHARGPMGLNEMISYKYIVRGNGEIRR